MTNKNLIVAYFKNQHAAEMAADGLKDWDKACLDIKLGGIGILTMEDDEVKSRMVGGRTTGTGAKWGTILGIAAGIFSGGLSIIGGAVAGLATGALAGALFHKRLGMSDEDKARLEAHLKDGGAAIATMASEDAVAATEAELASMGGDVENFSVPPETIKTLEENAGTNDH
ncbi:MAG: DUF1269 domain-containing protein [Candidatus Promineifilaceae bacterium]|nr:DUF1269 domain-containing protein [Candidatus Promineifilaceae bacterium]